MPKISVILPVYNVEKYLPKCLDSLLAQTMSDFEIIAVNDGSTDESLAILKEYAINDYRFQIVEQTNGGAGKARNTGLDIAQGTYLSFLDADDFFEPELLEKASSQCEKDGADIAIYKFKTYDGRANKYNDILKAFKKKYIPHNVPFSYKDMPKYIFNTFYNFAWNKMFRKSFVINNKIRFQEIHRTNDLLFTCTALVCAGKITLIYDSLVNYRINNNQLKNNAVPLDFLDAFYALKETLCNMGIYSEVEQSYVNWIIDGTIHNLNSLKMQQSFNILYSKLHNKVFHDLCADVVSVVSNEDKDYFYEPRLYNAFSKIYETPLTQHTFNEWHESIPEQENMQKIYNNIYNNIENTD